MGCLGVWGKTFDSNSQIRFHERMVTGDVAKVTCARVRARPRRKFMVLLLCRLTLTGYRRSVIASLLVGFQALISTATAQMTPTATTSPANQIMSESAQLNAFVSPNNSDTHVGFQYVDSQNRGNVTSFIDIGLTPQAVSISVRGLRPNMTYSFYVVAYNGYGTVHGSTLNFTTSSAPPSAQTQSATSVKTNSAILNGVVDPKNAATVAYFQYGDTDSYGSETTHTNCGLDSKSVAALLAGLSPTSTYHYQLVASNAFGISYGGDMTFTTPNPPARLEPTFFTSAGFRILLHTFGPGTYAVDGSSDFVTWDNVGTYLNPQEPTEVLDWFSIGSPMRFYRAYQLP